MSPARDARQLVSLLRRADQAFARAGVGDPADRVTMLRGIYYGTDWSLDRKVEGNSIFRTVGFFFYTGGTMPDNPTPILGKALFADLQQSQSINTRELSFDLGHALIGMDARRSSKSRDWTVPTQGGTGFEIVTWLGDLGGGAANLAYSRVRRPKSSVASVFPKGGSDYGAPENLEGDLAGCFVAAGGTPGGPLSFVTGHGVADAFDAYLQQKGLPWKSRAERFCVKLGAKVHPRNLEFPPSVTEHIADQIYSFAVFYMTTRWVTNGELRGKDISTACRHLRTAAFEVAIVFLRALVMAARTPGSLVVAKPPWPPPTPPDSDCGNSSLLALSLGERGGSQVKDWTKDLIHLLD